MGREIINIKDIKLSEESKKELADIEKKIRGDMTDEEWAFFKTVKDVTPVEKFIRLEKEAGNDIRARHSSTKANMNKPIKTSNNRKV